MIFFFFNNLSLFLLHFLSFSTLNFSLPAAPCTPFSPAITICIFVTKNLPRAGSHTARSARRSPVLFRSYCRLDLSSSIRFYTVRSHTRIATIATSCPTGRSVGPQPRPPIATPPPLLYYFTRFFQYFSEISPIPQITLPLVAGIFLYHGRLL